MLASEGTGNFDKKGSTSSSPIDLRVVFLFFSPFLRFDESEELTIGGPWRKKKKKKRAISEYFDKTSCNIIFTDN